MNSKNSNNVRKNIKVAISIVAIAFSSLSIAQADEKSRKSERSHDKASYQKPHNRNNVHQNSNPRHADRSHAQRRGHGYRRNHNRAYVGSYRHSRYIATPRYVRPHYSAPTYIASPHYSAPVVYPSHSAVVSGDHDVAGAVLGGALFGAIVGSALASH